MAAPTRRSSWATASRSAYTSSRSVCGDYLSRSGAALTEPPFLDEIVVRVGIADHGRPLPRAAAAVAVRLQRVPGIVMLPTSTRGHRRLPRPGRFLRGAGAHDTDVPVAADARRPRATRAVDERSGMSVQRRPRRQPARRVSARARPHLACSSVLISTPFHTPARLTACSASCWPWRSSICFSAGASVLDRGRRVLRGRGRALRRAVHREPGAWSGPSTMSS